MPFGYDGTWGFGLMPLTVLNGLCAPIPPLTKERYLRIPVDADYTLPLTTSPRASREKEFRISNAHDAKTAGSLS